MTETRITEKLLLILCSDDAVHADRIACKICSLNLVLPLLLYVQSDVTSQEQGGEQKACATSCLEQLVQYSHRRLARAGWHIKKKGTSLGSYIYQHTSSGEQSETPQLEGQTWEHNLLHMILLLMVHGMNESGELWAVQVLHHSVPITTVLTQLSELICQQDLQLIPLACAGAPAASQWSIIDVLKFPDDEDTDATSSLQSHSSQIKRGPKQQQQQQEMEDGGVMQNSTILRQLVLGPWRGPNDVAFSESSTQTAPGDALETWHETTMAGLCVLGLKQAERQGSGVNAGVQQQDHTPQISSTRRTRPTTLLVLGAGQLSAVMNFIHTYHYSNQRRAGSFTIVMVEEDRQLADRAMQLLQHPATCMKTYDSADQLHRSLQGEDCVDEGNTCLHIASYAEFIACWQRTLANRQSSRLFDAILVGKCLASSLSPASLIPLLQPWGVAVLAGDRRSAGASREKDVKVVNDEEGGGWCPHTTYLVEEMTGGTPQDIASTTATAAASTAQKRKMVLTLIAPAVPMEKSATFATDHSSSSRGPALPISVALWDQLFTARHETDTGTTTEDSQLQGRGGQSSLPLSMDVLQAQCTAAVLLPQLISAEEASQLHAMAGRTPAGGRDWATTGLNHGCKLGCEIRSQQSKLWEVLFLQSRGAFMTHMSGLLDRVVERVIALDCSQQWGFQLAQGNFCLRVCEYHSQVAPSEALPDTHHYDQDSLVTVDIMLSNPEVDFAGADIQTLEQDGTLLRHVVRQYDALCFLSHKYHSVTPLAKGRRVVCVLEFWRGSVSSRTCPHRCLSVGQRCKLEEAQEDEKRDDQDSRLFLEGDEEGDGPSFPFKLAAAQHHADVGIADSEASRSSGSGSEGGRLVLLWQATDASEGVVTTQEVEVGGMDEDAVAQLDDMFGDDDSDSDGDSDHE